jgi:hypothetical protein
MKVAFYSVFPSQMGNRLFSDPNVASGDNLLLPFIRLRKVALQYGIDCQTADMAELNEFDAFVFCEMPERRNRFLQYAKQRGRPTSLIISENYFIRKENADRKRYGDFDTVLTYDDNAVDGQRVLKLNYAFDLPCSIDFSVERKKKLACMIFSNPKRDRKNLIYAQRRDTIHWFEKWHPDDFDLYGFGWDRGTAPFQSYPVLQRFLRHIGILKILPWRKYTSWKGCVVRKRDILGKYRFGFCYENTDKIPGYITEKIFDVMLSGTVPVYIGAENTGSHIPQNCYINRVSFQDHETLYTYIANMPEAEYMTYLQNIQNFLSTSQSSEFSITMFVQTLLSALQRKRKD